MKSVGYVAVLIATAAISFIAMADNALPVLAQRTNLANKISCGSVGQFKGLCYGPYRDNENPDCGVQPSDEELRQDIGFMKGLTKAVRTYGVTDNMGLIPELCQQQGIECYPGAWISRYPCENRKEVAQLIEIARRNLSQVKCLIVGSEVLLRDDVSEDKLIEFISEVKAATTTPVATAEIWVNWLNHPRVAEAVDVMFVHIYPFWEGISVDSGAAYVLEKWNEVRAMYPGKAMVIGETGWPSEGQPRGAAVPGEENQRKYVSELASMTDQNGIDCFFFEVFDEKWKVKGGGEGDVGDHWGLYRSDGSLKPQLIDLVPDSVRDGMSRGLRTILPTKASLPPYVYADACDPRNSFSSSGWMGELVTFGDGDSLANPAEILDEACTLNPFSGATCIRISYTPSPGQWGGIYWQFPVNNWGVYPGYDLSGAIGAADTTELTFYAKGQSGGEQAEFITGKINDPELPYRDSHGGTTGVVTLTTNWTEYHIDLSGLDLSMVIGGFAWVTEYLQNPEGCTIYLDEIKFDSPVKTGVADESDVLPGAFALDQNYPNPFNSSTVISYETKSIAPVAMEIFNILGQRVFARNQEPMEPGRHSFAWNGTDQSGTPVPCGLYFYRVTTAGVQQPRKMVLLK